MTHTLPELGFSNFYQSQLTLEEVETDHPLRVMEVHRNALDTLGETGPHRVPMTGDLIDHGVAVGDWVLADRETNRPTRVLERKSTIQRRGAGDEPTAQLIAANIDTLFITSSCNADFNLARLERYLALARQADVEPVVVLTKADLCDDPAIFRQKLEIGMPGVAVETIDSQSPDTLEQLAPWCGKGQTVALIGSSGVGKTTITNCLTGREILTRAIREDDAKGKHTTTTRSMYHMINGGWLIDTPGMRALRLYDVAEGVDIVFKDVASLVTQCRFNDCAHDTEPGCAIQAAIEAGDLDADRLKRWQKLQREDTRNSETIAQSRARFKGLAKKYRGGKAHGAIKRGDH